MLSSFVRLDSGEACTCHSPLFVGSAVLVLFPPFA